MSYNAADPKQVKEAKVSEKEARKQELQDINAILTTVGGRRFFYRYLVACHVFETSMTGSAYTYFNEGERNVGLRLMADLNDANPEAYSQIIRENRRVEK